jgi:serine/threonine protein kinase
MDRYEVQRKIGQGSFGSVHLAVHRKSRKNFVIKEIRTSRLTEKEKDDVGREIELLSKLSHPNIVEYVESFQDLNG